MAARGPRLNDTPVFFVPAATDENRESVYAGFAKMCGVSAPELSKRVYSITFRHNGDVWVATVGERLQGKKYTTKRIGGVTHERSQALGDPALVLAIFPGVPFQVVTDHDLARSVGSRWANPFLAGSPDSIGYFSP